MGNSIQSDRGAAARARAKGARTEGRYDDDNDAEIIEQLLNNELRVDFVDSDRATPLHHAAQRGKLNLVRLLLAKGAKIDAQTAEGCTPLHLAAREQKVAVCKYLLEEGADANARDKAGSTPLHYVCQTAFSCKILLLLIAKGAKADAVMRDGRNGLHLVARQMRFPAQLNQSKICQVLLDNGCPIDVADNKRLTPLHYAILNGQLELCKVLIDHGAFIGSLTQDRRTPLHIAAEHNHYDIVELLLEKGAYVNAACSSKSTPLHVAAKADHPKVAKLLLFVNADPNLRDSQGETALHVAARLGHRPVLDTILKFSDQTVDINATLPSSGATAMHLAAKQGHISVVEALLDHGAFYNAAAKFPCPFTPLALARLQNRKPVVKSISRVKAMMRAAKKDSTGEVVACVKGGAQINARDSEDGRCALHYAAINGNQALAEYLMSKNANVGLRTKDGHTVLHLALAKGKFKLVPILIKYAAAKLNHDQLTKFLDAQTQVKRETALHKAVKKANLDLVRLLIGSGATYNLKNKSGLTPAEMAKGELKVYLSAVNDLFKVAVTNDSRRLSEIIEKQPSVAHARDSVTGRTALNISAPIDGIGTVKAVLKD